MALAVATLWDGNAGFRCAILGWCQSASAFGRELSLARSGGASRVDLLMLLPPEVNESSARETISTDCPHIIIRRPDARLRAAVEAFSAPERGLCSNGLNAHNVSVRGVTHRSAGVAMLYKWFVVGLSEYVG